MAKRTVSVPEGKDGRKAYTYERQAGKNAKPANPVAPVVPLPTPPGKANALSTLAPPIPPPAPIAPVESLRPPSVDVSDNGMLTSFGSHTATVPDVSLFESRLTSEIADQGFVAGEYRKNGDAYLFDEDRIAVTWDDVEETYTVTGDEEYRAYPYGPLMVATHELYHGRDPVEAIETVQGVLDNGYFDSMEDQGDPDDDYY